MRITRLPIPVVMFVILVTACGGGSDGPSAPDTPAPIASVVLTPNSISLTPGGTAPLTATTRDAQGGVLSGRAITWMSTAVSVATVSPSGVVTAVAPGTATINATSEGKSGSATVTVGPTPVASVVLSSATATVVAGQTVQLAAIARDANGNTLANRVVTWTSTAVAIATVGNDGLVTGVTPGTATIRATSEGKSAESVVTVTPVPVATVVLSTAAATLVPGQPFTLVATTRDAAGATLTGRDVTWSSTATAVASVTQGGVVTAHQPGEASIAATSEGQTANAVMTVTGNGAWITSAGGTITAAGGAVVLDIPAGAVAAGTAITATAVTSPTHADSVVPGTAFDFAPSGLTFSQPVTVRLRYAAGTLPNGVDPARLKVRRFTAGRWAGIPGTTVVDAATRTVTTQLTSFSRYAIGCCILPDDIAQIQILAQVTTMPMASTLNIGQVARDSEGRTLPFTGTWSSDHPTIATVSSAGLLQTIAPGTATIKATVPIPGGTDRVGSMVMTVTGLLSLFPDNMFVTVPAGTFNMGVLGGATSETPVHEVTISKPFQMLKVEVTQPQWIAVMQSNPSIFPACNICPVDHVLYSEAVEFVTRLNTLDPGKNYRLPTEAEWEYAARAGQTGHFPYSYPANEVGWNSSNSEGRTHGNQFRWPNAWNIYDMHGNVFEWTSDWYSQGYYAVSPAVDPQGPAEGTVKVLRGGSYSTPPQLTRWSARFVPVNMTVRPQAGVRLVRDAPAQGAARR